MKIIVTGDCQSEHLASMLRLVVQDAEITQLSTALVGNNDHRQLTRQLDECDVWVRQQIPQDAWAVDQLPRRARLIEHPPVLFDGFHPDITVAIAGDAVLSSFCPYSSRIALWGWKTGMSPAQTVALFTPETFARLGYLDRWRIAATELRSAYERSGLDVERMWARLLRIGVFMHTWNHPTMEYFSLLARAIGEALQRAGVRVTVDWDEPLTDLVTNEANGAVWPVYPAIAQHLGVPGSYRWRFGPDVVSTLDEFLERSWIAYGDTDTATVRSVAKGSGALETELAEMVHDINADESEAIGIA